MLINKVPSIIYIVNVRLSSLIRPPTFLKFNQVTFKLFGSNHAEQLSSLRYLQKCLVFITPMNIKKQKTVIFRPSVSGVSSPDRNP